MNQISRRIRHEEELARAQGIVVQHSLPDFVTRFEVRFGEFDGDPAMWVVFRTAFKPDPEDKNLQAELQAMRVLRDGVEADLRDAFEDRWPYTRFEPEAALTGAPR